MARYKSKSRYCQAGQYFPDQPGPSGIQLDVDGRAFVVTTHGNRVYLVSGDWVVKEPDGNGYYPIKPHIFDLAWEWDPE